MPEITAKVKDYLQTNGGKNLQTQPEQAPRVHVRWGQTRRIGNGWPEKMYYAGAFSRAGNTDAFLIDSHGDLWLYPSNNFGERFGARTQAGNGWNGMAQIMTGSDFDGDGLPDVIGRHKDGRLFLYPGNGRSGFKDPKLIGWGWNNFTGVYLMPAFDSGKPLIYGVSKDGSLRAYLTDGKGSFTGSFVVANGWNNIRLINNVTDINEDGLSDVLAVDNMGDMWLYRGLGGGRLASGVKAGYGWTNIVTIQSIPSTNYLWAVHKNGDLLKYTLLGVQ